MDLTDNTIIKKGRWEKLHPFRIIEDKMVEKLLTRIISAIGKLETPADQAVYRDLFALGCYLNIKGEKIASTKAIRTVCKALDEEDMVKKILEHMNGNEKEFAEKIWAHSEILNLFS